jgi:hypothetical protein
MKGLRAGRKDGRTNDPNPPTPPPAHLHQQNVKATMVDRVGSWQNYAALFTALIEDDDGRATTEAAAKHNGAELVVTGKWAFDVIYEFVYQFQEACQYRASAVSACMGGGAGRGCVLVCVGV